jgi:hypothetical protein
MTRGAGTRFPPPHLIKMKKRPNHHHAIVTKSCLKPHSVLKSKPHGEGENEEETSHSSFSHWAADAAGGEHDEQEQEGDDSFGAGSMVMALPDDSADNDDALLIAMAAETSTGSNMVEENKKAVAFSSKASRKSTLALSGYTHEEILNTWYSRYELYDMFDEAQERGVGRTRLSRAASSSRSSAPPPTPGVEERGADRHTYLTSQAHAERMGLSRTVSTVNGTTRSSSTTRIIHKGDEKRANEKMKGDSKNVKKKKKKNKNNATTATNSTNDGAGGVDEYHEEEGNNKNDPSASPPEYSSYTVPAAKNSSSPQQQGRQCKLPFVFGRWMKRKPQQEHRPSSR